MRPCQETQAPGIDFKCLVDAEFHAEIGNFGLKFRSGFIRMIPLLVFVLHRNSSCICCIAGRSFQDAAVFVLVGQQGCSSEDGLIVAEVMFK